MGKGNLMLAAAALVLIGCVSVSDNETRLAASGAAPAEVVAARQAAFTLSGAAMGNVKGAIDRGDDPKTQAFAARGLARWARALPGMFPEGTAAVTPTRARPEIWTNKADFEARAAAYAAAATQLAEAAQSGDKAAFAAGWDATRKTCAACHDLYQVPQS